MEIGELNLDELRLELHGEWSEFADECVALNASTEERDDELLARDPLGARFPPKQPTRQGC